MQTGKLVLDTQIDMNINAIYRAIEGEGVFVGVPQIFVRLQGCRVFCKNCDSKDTWSFNAKQTMTQAEVIQEIASLAGAELKRVSITGGDPTDERHLPAVIQLVRNLKQQGFTVTLEASGNVVNEELFDLLDFINFDFKTPSTGVETDFELLFLMKAKYSGKHQIKSVVESLEDFEYCFKFKRVLDRYRESLVNDPWVLTPAYSPSEHFPRQRVEDIYQWNFKVGGLFRVILQQHKMIYGPDRKNI